MYRLNLRAPGQLPGEGLPVSAKGLPLEGELRAGGVGEGETEGPEGDLAGAAAVFGITEEREAAGGELDADLVGAARLEADEEEGEAVVGGEEAVGKGGLLRAAAHTADNEALVAGPVVEEEVAADGGFLQRVAADDAEVFLLEGPALNGGGEGRGCCCGAGEDDEAAYAPVQAVDWEDLAAALGAEEGGESTVGTILADEAGGLEADEKGFVLE